MSCDCAAPSHSERLRVVDGDERGAWVWVVRCGLDDEDKN